MSTMYSGIGAMKPVKFALGSEEMWNAFTHGVENYIPIQHGCSLNIFEEEGGITDVSRKNIEKIISRAGYPKMILVGPEGGMLFIWSATLTYLATGFAIGYSGEGPSKLAEMIAKFKFGNDVGFEKIDGIRQTLASKDRNFQGVLEVF